MRKSFSAFIFAVLIVTGFCLTVSASLNVSVWEYDIAFENLQEYEEFIKCQGTQDAFVTYEELCFLGDFQKFKVHNLVWNAGEGGDLYYYELIDENNFLMQIAIRLRKTYTCYDERILQGVEGEARKKYEIFWLSEEFKSGLHSNIHLWETPLKNDDLRFGNGFHSDFLQYGKVRYQYERDVLQYIVVNLEDVEIKIWGTEEHPLSQYPTEGRSSMLSRMLNYATAKEAAEEFSARVDGGYEKPWEHPLAICLSAIGGAVVAGVGAWLITFLVMRKKRGAPIPAMAGAPTGEVLAGSDVDASAVPSGAAPAPPESSTPPESPTPPEAAATDEPSKNE